eukprot:TRINITY_DN14052_c0_g1_i1.p3 TRINITY_DN14052_c0_g1~~TRINITY_DN14052_c0_g1_i1.p3  ORF type:complete len:100 (-),score=36.75 TRINITY_DN14052_c0_g1_i1:90-389(-)
MLYHVLQCFCFFFFFFKQKTAYEMQRGLVGSEMCIRDRIYIVLASSPLFLWKNYIHLSQTNSAVSYTHLTLPTILLVQISVVAVSLKKKNIKQSRYDQK